MAELALAQGPPDVKIAKLEGSTMAKRADETCHRFFVPAARALSPIASSIPVMPPADEEESGLSIFSASALTGLGSAAASARRGGAGSSWMSETGTRFGAEEMAWLS